MSIKDRELFEHHPYTPHRTGLDWLLSFTFYNEDSFENVNYVKNKDLYLKLKAAVGRIQISYLNIADNNQIENLFAALSSKNLKISVFDFSNAIQFAELTQTQTYKMLQTFKKYSASKDAVVLLSKVSYDLEGYYALYSLKNRDTENKLNSLSAVLVEQATLTDFKLLGLPYNKNPFFPPSIDHRSALKCHMMF